MVKPANQVRAIKNSTASGARGAPFFGDSFGCFWLLVYVPPTALGLRYCSLFPSRRHLLPACCGGHDFIMFLLQDKVKDIIYELFRVRARRPTCASPLPPAPHLISQSRPCGPERCLMTICLPGEQSSSSSTAASTIIMWTD